jgi:B12-binding domain/radical SAM domain protein
MESLLVFRRTRLNHNSFASVVGALVRAGLPEQFRVAFVNRSTDWPQEARIAAFSFCTPELERVSTEIRQLRDEFSDRLVIAAGGPHPSADPEGTLRLGFDAVFVGEGEETFPPFVRGIAEGDRPEGIIVRSRPPGIDLDSCLHVVAEYGLFPFAEISRGCPCGCAYCQTSPLFHRRMRHRSPEIVARGVRQAMQVGYRRIRYLTPNAFAYAGGTEQKGTESLRNLLETIRLAGARQQMLGNFPSEVRPEYVSSELLGLVRDYCVNRTIVLGAQSGSDRVLRLMHRGHTVEQTRKAISTIARAGFVPHVDILLGFPGEQPEERVLTLDLARWSIAQASARIHAHVYIPLPGTSAWPALPEPLEPAVVLALRNLEAEGHLDGDWVEQTKLGPQIVRLREEKTIRV